MPIKQILIYYIRYGQVRRIACEHCDNPFCYLCVETRKIEMVGGVFDEHALHEAASDNAKKHMRLATYKPRRGEALCPHCQRYQGWMVTQSRIRKLLWGVKWGLIVGAIAVPVWLGVVTTGLFGDLRNTPMSTQVLGPLIVFTVLGVVFGALKTIKGGEHPGAVDPRAYTDEQFLNHLAEAEKYKDDPIESWFQPLLAHTEYPVTSGGAPRPNRKYAVFSLGLKDDVDPPLQVSGLASPWDE